MVDNPYKPPTAPVKDAPAPPRSPIVAVIAGLAVDFGGTFVGGIALGVGYAAMLASEGQVPEQIQESLTAPEALSGYFVVSSALGALFSFLGGYVCARTVRRNELRVTAFLALVVVVLGLLLSRGTTLGAGALAALHLLTIAVVLLGGEVGRRRNLASGRRESVGMR
jgi:hypothetical protein